MKAARHTWATPRSCWRGAARHRSRSVAREPRAHRGVAAGHAVSHPFRPEPRGRPSPQRTVRPPGVDVTLGEASARTAGYRPGARGVVYRGNAARAAEADG